MKILIIRHGDPDYELDSLTDKGFREAKLLATRLKNENIDNFYCSPLGRAQRTSEPTLAYFGKSAETLDWLQEFRGRIKSPFSGKERVSWDLPPHLWCRDEKNYELHNWHESELIKSSTAKEFFDKTAEGVDQLLARYGVVRDGMAYVGESDKTIAVFCHFCLGITVLAHILGISPVVAQNNFYLAPTSVTTLVTETDSKGVSHFRATGVGDISHLYAGDEPMSESGLYPNFEK